MPPGGGTQYKSGYRDVPQTWVAKSGRQVHQWVLFSKTWYFDGSIFQNFLNFAPKWRKFGTLIGQLFKNFSKFAPKWRKFQRKILIFGTWMGHFSFKMGTWMGGISKIPAAHPYPDQSWVPPRAMPLMWEWSHGATNVVILAASCHFCGKWHTVPVIW